MPSRLIACVASIAAFVAPALSRAVPSVFGITTEITHVVPEGGAESWIFRLDAEGLDFTSVDVTPPAPWSDPPVSLVCAGPGDCSYAETFVSLAALQARFAAGSYLFDFDGGALTRSVTHRGYTPPADGCYPDFDPRYPDDPHDTTDPETELFWTCSTDCQTADECGASLADSGGAFFDVGYEPPLPPLVTITVPDGVITPSSPNVEGSIEPLVPGETWDFNCSCKDVELSADDVHEDATGVENVVQLPEPRGGLLVGALGVACLARRRSRT